MSLPKKFDAYLARKDRSWFENFLLNTFDKMIPDSTWVKDLRDMPGFYMYFAAGLFNIMWWGVFLYFIITAYISGVEDSFISLDESSGNCDEVPFSITGSYLVDQSGRWESNKNFDDATALYGTEFLAFGATTSQYENLIRGNVTDNFKAVGDVGVKRDLAWNLVAHAAFSYRSKNYGNFEIYPAGEFVTMLDKEYSQYGAAESQAGLSDPCFTGMQYDSTASQIFATYAYNSSSDECQSIGKSLGFNANYGDDVELALNLISFSTATAVNYGIISASTLVEITDSPETGYSYDTDDGSFDFSYGGTDDFNDDSIDQNVTVRKLTSKKESVLKANSDSIRKKYENQRRFLATTTTNKKKFRLFYDSKYAGMDPIACIVYNSTKKNSTCFVQYSVPSDTSSSGFDPIYAYPIAKHYAGTNCYDTTAWPASWYASDPTRNGDWVDTYDHTIDIMLGLIFFRNVDDAAAFAEESFNHRYADPVKGDLFIPDRVYPSMRAIVDGDGTYSPEDVCGINSTSNTARDCFMVAFNQYGSNFYINPHNYQLFAGACRNSVYNNNSIVGIAKVTPEPLVQTYYDCKLAPYDSFFNALGLSLGNADVYAKFAFFAFMLVFTLSLLKCGVFDPELGVFEAPESEDNTKSVEVELPSVSPMR